MKLDVPQVMKDRPVATGITIGSLLVGVVVFMNFLPAMELVVSIKNAPQVAQAARAEAGEAKAKAEETREWIDAYIADQEKQRTFDRALRERELEYQRQLIELQRQQAPNTASQPTWRWQEEDQDGQCWRCDEPDYDDCFTEQRWEKCE